MFTIDGEEDGSAVAVTGAAARAQVETPIDTVITSDDTVSSTSSTSSNNAPITLAGQIEEYQHHLVQYLTATCYNNALYRCSHKSLASSSIRSVYWRCIWLHSELTAVNGNWTAVVTKHRTEYEQLYAKYMAQNDITKSNGDSTQSATADMDDDLDPLSAVAAVSTKSRGSKSAKASPANSSSSSQPPQSRWHTYWQDTELLREIEKDLQRTHSDVPFFQTAAVQSVMLHTLYVWSKQNSEISYRQGMNEIVALITHVYYREYHAQPATTAAPTKSATSATTGNHILHTLLDEAHIEADVFHAFQHIMTWLSPLYAHNKRSLQYTESPIQQHTQRMQYALLGGIDIQLCQHLQTHDVMPQLYALRWYRLLFAREFSQMSDTLAIWDSTFATAPSTNSPLDFVDYIAISMLIYKRTELLLAEHNSELLTILMQYAQHSQHVDVRRIVDLAHNAWNNKLHVLPVDNGKDKAPAKQSALPTATPKVQPSTANVAVAVPRAAVAAAPAVAVQPPAAAPAASPDSYTALLQGGFSKLTDRFNKFTTRIIEQQQQAEAPERSTVTPDATTSTASAFNNHPLSTAALATFNVSQPSSTLTSPMSRQTADPTRNAAASPSICSNCASHAELATRLSSAIDTLSLQFASPLSTHTAQLANDDVLQAIASIKQVRDVLQGKLSTESLTPPRYKG